MIEHYSRDKVILRILNTLSFVVLFSLTSWYMFQQDNYSIINTLLNTSFFMSPVRVVYGLGVVAIFLIALFIIVQIDTSSHGIKKRVVENYGVTLTLGNTFASIWVFFFDKTSFNKSLIAIIMSIIFYGVLYIRAHQLKKFMYNDEKRVFVTPFSVVLPTVIIFLVININIVITKYLDPNFSTASIISFIEIMFITLVSVITQILFKDRALSVVNIIFLVCVAIQRVLDDDFMPTGYICFLSIVIILTCMYRVFRKKISNKGDY